MKLNFLNSLVDDGEIKLQTQSQTNTKYETFEEAFAEVKSATSNKKYAQLKLLNILKSQPVMQFADLVQYSWNLCRNKENYKEEKYYKRFIEKSILELPASIIPIPVFRDD
eukprot:290865_1